MATDQRNSSPDGTYDLNVRDVRRRFDRAAASLPDADFVHRACFAGITERLAPMTLAPARILDLGCGYGGGRESLQARYRDSEIVGADLSLAMLKKLRGVRRGWFGDRRPPAVQADAHRLPFATAAFDVVVANLLLPWTPDLSGVAREIARVLRVDGLFVFATLGPDSLSTLGAAWAAEDAFVHIHRFADMHDVGDALVRAGLRDPVLDVDQLEVTYPDAQTLFADLRFAGALNLARGRRPTLTGRKRLARVRERLDAGRVDGRLTVDLEVVYGHAWGGGAPGEHRLDPAQIGRIRRA